MDAEREELLEQLEAHYRQHGWKVRRAEDGTLRAVGPGGVIWIGRAVVSGDLGSNDFERRLAELADQRMPGGNELCPLDLVATADCESRTRELLERLALSRRPHVSLYSVAA